MQENSTTSFKVKGDKLFFSTADEKLFKLLKDNNEYAWNCIYDKYAPLMYGNILNIIKDKSTAEKIFISAFSNLKTENKPIPCYCSMPNFLCMYAKNYANKFCKSSTHINL